MKFCCNNNKRAFSCYKGVSLEDPELQRLKVIDNIKNYKAKSVSDHCAYVNLIYFMTGLFSHKLQFLTNIADHFRSKLYKQEPCR